MVRLGTKYVKTAFHACFDKGMNDLPTLLNPCNIQHLQHVQHGIPLPSKPSELTPTSLTFTDMPFLNESDESIPVTCTASTFGITLATNVLSS
jgi:hypothetical protein